VRGVPVCGRTDMQRGCAAHCRCRALHFAAARVRMAGWGRGVGACFCCRALVGCWDRGVGRRNAGGRSGFGGLDSIVG
jgi:hypothetical protein